MARFQLKQERYSGPYKRYLSPEKKEVADGKDDLGAALFKELVQETHGSYGALILHPNWKAKRKEILERDLFKCVICGNGLELQVHHRQYHFVKAINSFKAPWDYPDHLLITLCSKCHNRGHSKFKVPSINL